MDNRLTRELTPDQRDICERINAELAKILDSAQVLGGEDWQSLQTDELRRLRGRWAQANNRW